jgi:hypothetical protein
VSTAQDPTPAEVVGARPRRRRRLLWTTGVVLLALLLLGGWLAVQARSVQHDLLGARADLERARTSLAAGDARGARSAVDAAGIRTGGARHTTSSVLWSIAAAVPVLGRPLETVDQLTAVSDDLVSQVLSPTVEAAGTVNLATLRASDGTVNLAALGSASPEVHAATGAADALAQRAREVPAAGWIGAVDDARTQLVDQTGTLAVTLRDADQALTLLPPMLGRDGPRTYFVGFQTNAESRGTGGLIGSYGILTADAGRLSFAHLGSNEELKDGAAPGIDLGPEYAQLYGAYASNRSWQNGNISPHFPYAAQVWASLWEKQSGQHLDGVIATDPVALGYLLAATGPVTLPSGEVVGSDDVARLTESEAYARFADDNSGRKAYLTTLAGTVAARLFGAGAGTVPKLVTELGRAAGEGRIAVWSVHPEEQAVLASTTIGHVVTETTQPYAQLVVTNSSGNKMDYYLARSISYSAGTCGGLRSSTVTVTLTNTAATGAGLTAYVAGVAGAFPPGTTPGTDRLIVSLYATAGAGLEAVSADGSPTTVQVGAELGHPVFTLPVSLAPTATTSLSFQLLEPSAPGPAVVPIQPLVLPMTVHTDVPTC